MAQSIAYSSQEAASLLEQTEAEEETGTRDETPRRDPAAQGMSGGMLGGMQGGKPAGNAAPKPERSSRLGGCTERLRGLVQQSGGTKHVAARAGVALSTLGSYLAGGEMKLSTALQICEACNTSLAWLVGESPSSPAVSHGASKDWTTVRRRPDPGGAGTQDGVAFSSNWIRRVLERDVTELLAVEVRGRAMEPTLYEGDLVLVDTTATSISSLDLHVIEIDGEVLVRRLERTLDGGIVIRTDNERFRPRMIDRKDRSALTLVGRVVWRGGGAPL